LVERDEKENCSISKVAKGQKFWFDGKTKEKSRFYLFELRDFSINDVRFVYMAFLLVPEFKFKLLTKTHINSRSNAKIMLRNILPAFQTFFR
jgi:hypothetical protein